MTRNSEVDPSTFNESVLLRVDELEDFGKTLLFSFPERPLGKWDRLDLTVHRMSAALGTLPACRVCLLARLSK